jgi:hypothetical protein
MIAADPSILGLDILLVGRQVQTDFGGRIDILALDRDGGLVLIELKRDKTPREIVAQVLDYASWVVKLSTKQVHDLALHYREKPLSVLFREHFDAPLPENLNTSHSLLIVAGSLDQSSKRIVEYLSREWDLSINTAFSIPLTITGNAI